MLGMFLGVSDKTFCTCMQNRLSVGIQMCEVWLCRFSEELYTAAFVYTLAQGSQLIAMVSACIYV